jgi:hypothetical protein
MSAMSDPKTIRRVQPWRHTHNGSLPGQAPIPLYRERHTEPGLDLYLYYERDVEFPTWSHVPGGGITLLSNPDPHFGHGLIVEDARNES